MNETKDEGAAPFALPALPWAEGGMDRDRLAVAKTANADTPPASGAKPLAVIDVRERAYCPD